MQKVQTIARLLKKYLFSAAVLLPAGLAAAQAGKGMVKEGVLTGDLKGTTIARDVV